MQPGQPIFLSCVPLWKREEFHILIPQTPIHCQEQQMTHEYTRQADKGNETGFQRHQEFLPLPLGHFSHPEKPKKWAPRGASGSAFLGGCAVFFNVQISHVKRSQLWVRGKMRWCVGVFIQSSMVAFGRKSMFLSYLEGRQSTSNLASRTTELLQDGLPRSFPTESWVVSQAWSRTIPPASTQTFG